MCILVDVNVLPSVFQKSAKYHFDFEPVYNFIRKGKGKIVYGGSKYISELKSMGKYIAIMSELNKIHKVCKLDDSEVDKIQKELEKKISDSDFDDPHLIAIVILSGCKVVCTDDKRAIPFLRNKRRIIFDKPSMRPNIYRNMSHSHLLKNANCSPQCVKNKLTSAG